MAHCPCSVRSTRRRDRHLPRHRTEQAPRLPQPVGPRRQDDATATVTTTGDTMADRYEIRAARPAAPPGRAVHLHLRRRRQAIHDFTTVSRVHRDDTELQGYQRPEVLSHIRAIRRYLESDGAMLPNAIVLAFDERVTFEADATQARRRLRARRASSSSRSTSPARDQKAGMAGRWPAAQRRHPRRRPRRVPCRCSRLHRRTAKPSSARSSSS